MDIGQAENYVEAMAKARIAFFDSRPYDEESFRRANERYGFDIHYLPIRLEPETASLAAGSDAVCIFVNDTASSDVIERLTGLGVRLIALRASGYNNVDLTAAHGKLPVVRVPAYSPHAVAEHAVALMLALNRKTHRAYFRTRDGNFAINGLLGFDMHGKTAGVIGTGKIGRAVAEILRGFGMNVLVHDVYPDAAWAAEVGASYVSLDELYSSSHIISLHCPLTPETVRMVNRESIARMKPGVMIINTGRGKLIDTKDLIAGLKRRHVGAAGLDVYEEEEHYFFEDLSVEPINDDVLARLLSFPNVLVTSHQGFFTAEAMVAIAETTLENVRLFLEEGTLRHQVNVPA